MKAEGYLTIGALALLATPVAPFLALPVAIGCAAYSGVAKQREALARERQKRVELPLRLLRQDAELLVASEQIDAGVRVQQAMIQAEAAQIQRNLEAMRGTPRRVATAMIEPPPALPGSDYVDVDLSALSFVQEQAQAQPMLADTATITGIRDGDLWQELEASNRHIWLVATTQSGKTWAEYAILTHAFDRSGGKAQAIITDIKGGAFTADCGIPDYYFSDDTNDMPRHAGNIDKAVHVLSLRRKARMANGGTWGSGRKPAPLFLVIPELNSFVKKCKEWDLLNPPPSKQDIAAGEEPRLKLAVQVGIHILEIITQGLEDNVRLVVDAQTSRIEEFDFGSGVKFTGGTRNNLSMAGISRNGDYIGIRDFFSFNCKGMGGNPEIALMNYDRQQPNKSVPIAATNMSGAVEIVQTPALDIKQMKRAWQAVGKPQSSQPQASSQPAPAPSPESAATGLSPEALAAISRVQGA